ncbi:MAG: hypothetical protein QG614_215 [Patescibacteria group bacterium]|nr:hypothetical protein [Patescibacteria group bacterium]
MFGNFFGGPQPSQQKINNTEKKKKPEEEKLSRRDFLKSGAKAAVAGTVVGVGLGGVAENVEAKDLSEEDMGKYDEIVRKSLSVKEGTEVGWPFFSESQNGKVVDPKMFNKYILIIKDKAKALGSTGKPKGVHFNNHDNARVVVETYEQYWVQKKIGLDPELLYYPHENSRFEVAASKVKGAKIITKEWDSPAGKQTSKMVSLPGDTISNLDQNKLVEGVVDAGEAYVILSKNMPVIKDKEGRYYMGPCRNPIRAFYNTCPPCI